MKETTQNTTEATNNLPELTGSEKQIAWATSIRAAAIQGCNLIRGTMRPREEWAADQIEKIESMYAACNTLFDSYENQTSSKWWIDNREYDDAAWFVRIRKELAKKLK